MTNRFCRQDLVDWAAFSGDHNPVHFDELLMRRQGRKGLIVHGMLAMLPMKMMAAVKLLAKGAGDQSLKIVLRKPVYVNERVTCSVTDGALQKLRLTNDAGELIYVGELLPEAVTGERSSPAQTLPDDVLQAKLSAFRERYPQAEYDWIFLDALAFSLYIDANGTSALASDTLHYLENTNPFNDGDILVYQISHTVLVKEKLLRRRGFSTGRMAYSLEGNGICSTGEHVVGSVIVRLYEDGQEVLSSVMELMVVSQQVSYQ